MLKSQSFSFVKHFLWIIRGNFWNEKNRSQTFKSRIKTQNSKRSSSIKIEYLLQPLKVNFWKIRRTVVLKQVKARKSLSSCGKGLEWSEVLYTHCLMSPFKRKIHVNMIDSACNDYKNFMIKKFRRTLFVGKRRFERHWDTFDCIN